MSVENGATMAKGMRAAMQGHQTGNRIILRATPKGRIYNGLKLGDITKILQPPGKYLNTTIAVFVKGLNGKPVALPFQYWMAVPKDAEINVPLFIANNKELTNKKAFVVPVMPVNTSVKAKTEKDQPVVVRRKVANNQTVIPARRK